MDDIASAIGLRTRPGFRSDPLQGIMPTSAHTALSRRSGLTHGVQRRLLGVDNVPLGIHNFVGTSTLLTQDALNDDRLAVLVWPVSV